jgi:hypothetical protein
MFPFNPSAVLSNTESGFFASPNEACQESAYSVLVNRDHFAG